MELKRVDNFNNCSNCTVDFPKVRRHAPDIIAFRLVFLAYLRSCTWITGSTFEKTEQLKSIPNFLF